MDLNDIDLDRYTILVLSNEVAQSLRDTIAQALEVAPEEVKGTPFFLGLTLLHDLLCVSIDAEDRAGITLAEQLPHTEVNPGGTYN